MAVNVLEDEIIEDHPIKLQLQFEHAYLLFHILKSFRKKSGETFQQLLRKVEFNF